MSRNHVFRSVLLAAGVLLMVACASQPGSPTLLDKKFQRAAQQFQKVQHQGQTLYCKRDDPTGPSGWRCLTEAQLRQEVESFERWRNPVQRPVIGTVSSIG
jgi:hypothetical protein